MKKQKKRGGKGHGYSRYQTCPPSYTTVTSRRKSLFRTRPRTLILSRSRPFDVHGFMFTCTHLIVVSERALQFCDRKCRTVEQTRGIDKSFRPIVTSWNPQHNENQFPLKLHTIYSSLTPSLRIVSSFTSAFLEREKVTKESRRQLPRSLSRPLVATFKCLRHALDRRFPFTRSEREGKGRMSL